jgi:hypothetical protein
MFNRKLKRKIKKLENDIEYLKTELLNLKIKVSEKAIENYTSHENFCKLHEFLLDSVEKNKTQVDAHKIILGYHLDYIEALERNQKKFPKEL